MGRLLTLLALLFLLIQENNAANYALVGDDMSFFEPCDQNDDDGNVNVGELVELKLTHDYADDLETLITNGNITINIDLPPDTFITGDIEIYKWERGHWVNTVFSLKRSDFCTAIFDPQEFWYTFVKQFPEEERVCPPTKGHIYQLKDIANRVELYDINAMNDFSGKYKAVFQFAAGEYSTCVSTVVNMWRI